MALTLSSALSTRDGIRIGTFAPTTTCAHCDPPRYFTAFPSKLPASILGTTMQSAYPAAGCLIPLASAADLKSAQSSATGPNTSTFPNSPAAHIATSAWASTVDGKEFETASVALMMAIFG